jgi:integral membrane sensor domain MASE1
MAAPPPKEHGVRIRKAVATVVLISLVGLWPASSALEAQQAHGVTSAQLHKAVLTSSEQVAAARTNITGLLERGDVQKDLHRLGVSPQRLQAQVGLLTDADVLKLQGQMMNAQLQNARSGLSSGAIVAIVLGGIAGSVMILWLELRAIDDDTYYYN